MPCAYTTAENAWSRLARAYKLDEDLDVRTFGPEAGAQYEATLREAFNFFRRNDDGRYSARMKMRVMEAADAAEAIRNGESGTASLPAVIVARRPYSYDDITEVKTGGTLAALVCWPEEEGRVILAVHKDRRRQRVGTMLVDIARRIGCARLTAWVNQRNITGQHFLLEAGLQPTAFNNSGGVCFRSDRTEDGREEPSANDEWNISGQVPG